MHASSQPGGRSPKSMLSMSQSKPVSENTQNTVVSFPSQIKGKKRERGDQGSDSVKRERSSKIDDSDSGPYKTESILKSEIAKITERGGLVDSEGVGKLIQLMQPYKMEKKMDLVCRSVLAGVVAATDKFDCLNQFVLLRGLPVLDEWLQDVHKGRIADGNPKDGDKHIEEFLLVLLQALDKLPVNLQALQMCNIGKSVNHLRSHKNLDIQKKARSLVDTWKKRVEAEMNVLDAKSATTQAGAWPSKSRLPDSSHCGNKNPGGSSDVSAKSSLTQLSASKTVPIKPAQGEATTKSASSSPRPTRSASSPAPGKDSQVKVSACGTPDSLLTREDKSSSSSQSHNHSQSCSGKEDARSSTAGSRSSNKISSCSSRHRKSSNGFPGTSVCGGQKESGTGRKISQHRSSTPEKLSQSVQLVEKVEVPLVEGGSHKLIVKIPNRGRSPAQSADGGSYEDPNNMSSRASSPVVSEKHDHFDRNVKEKNDAYQSIMNSDVNAESWQSNDFKDILTRSDEAEGSPAAALPDEERSKTVNLRKSTGIPKVASSLSGTELKSGKLHEASFSSVNALMESCSKYSERSVSISHGDAIGMNLLASVATEEMSKSDIVSPSISSLRNSSSIEETCVVDDTKSKSPVADGFASDHSQRNDRTDCGNAKQAVDVGSSWSGDKLHPIKIAASELSGDQKPKESLEETVVGDCYKQLNSSCIDSELCSGPYEMNEKSGERKDKAATSPTGRVDKANNGQLNKRFHEARAVSSDARLDSVPVIKMGESAISAMERKVSNSALNIDDPKRLCQLSSSNLPFEGDCAEVKPPATALESEVVERLKEEPISSSRDLIVDKVGGDYANQCERRSDKKVDRTTVLEDKILVGVDSAVTDQKRECNEGNVETKEIPVCGSVESESQNETVGISSLKVEKHMKSTESRLSDTTSDKTNSSVVPETGSKMEFDLNEGFASDDGKYGELISSTAPGFSTTSHVVSPLPFPIASVPGNLPAAVTVSAAAKWPFVPPEELLRFKGEIGWKGSAATSAFRPAEPRKSLDMALSSTSISYSEISTDKNSRPLLDFDLNVPDERVFEEIRDSALEIGSMSNHSSKKEASDYPSLRSSGGFDLDLNRLDESNDVGPYPASSGHRLERVVAPGAPSSSGLRSVEVRREFDLNNGPVVDDVSVEQSSLQQNSRGSLQSQSAMFNIRMNNPEIGSFCSLFPAGNSYPTVTVPSLLGERGEQPFPVIPPGAPRMFAPDVYRGSILASSPAVTTSEFPMFPFGTTFPLPSTKFCIGSASNMDSSYGGRVFAPTVNPQLQFSRPYAIDGSNNGGMDNNRKWSNQGLDLNAGPIEGREELVARVTRQRSVASSQAVADEHSGIVKRKDPPDSSDSFRYKQSAWK